MLWKKIGSWIFEHNKFLFLGFKVIIHNYKLEHNYKYFLTIDFSWDAPRSNFFRYWQMVIARSKSNVMKKFGSWIFEQNEFIFIGFKVIIYNFKLEHNYKYFLTIDFWDAPRSNFSGIDKWLSQGVKVIYEKYSGHDYLSIMNFYFLNWK